MRTTLLLKSNQSNTNAFLNVDGLHEDNLERDIGMTIRCEGNRFTISVRSKNLDNSKLWDDEISLNPLDLFILVQECRDVWQRTIIDYSEEVKKTIGGKENGFIFQEFWDHKERPNNSIRSLVGKLAVAGEKLFSLIFESSGSIVLNRIAAFLREEGRKRPLVMTIYANSFFVPWCMLYTHPNPNEPLDKISGLNYNSEGFWGLRHIIEHKIKEDDLKNEVRPNSNGRIPTCINIDESIDARLNVIAIKPQIAFFEGMDSLEVKINKERNQFLTALQSTSFSDRIIYFCCHGIGAGQPDAPNLANARLSLTDGVPITGADLQYILMQRSMSVHPVVFINACQGGQMSTIFYQTIGTQFLKYNALGLIGAQIDIPAIFATEYAQRFFRAFLNRTTRVRLGPLIRSLAQDFMYNHNNPLGLVYSLYRGADCFINWSEVASE